MHFHLRKDFRFDWEIKQLKGDDNFDFDEMIKDLGIKTTIRALKLPNKEYASRLRPRRNK